MSTTAHTMVISDNCHTWMEHEAGSPGTLLLCYFFTIALLTPNLFNVNIETDNLLLNNEKSLKYRRVVQKHGTVLQCAHSSVLRDLTWNTYWRWVPCPLLASRASVSQTRQSFPFCPFFLPVAPSTSRPIHPPCLRAIVSPSALIEVPHEDKYIKEKL